MSNSGVRVPLSVCQLHGHQNAVFKVLFQRVVDIRMMRGLRVESAKIEISSLTSSAAVAQLTMTIPLRTHLPSARWSIILFDQLLVTGSNYRAGQF